jgi:hypothetical protein
MRNLHEQIQSRMQTSGLNQNPRCPWREDAIDRDSPISIPLFRAPVFETIRRRKVLKDAQNMHCLLIEPPSRD